NNNNTISDNSNLNIINNNHDHSSSSNNNANINNNNNSIRSQNDGRFRKRIEQLNYRKRLKEPTYVLPKPVEPIFKRKFPATDDQEVLSPEKNIFQLPADHDYEEYGEFDEFYYEGFEENDDSYWKRGTNLTWPIYHRPWARSRSWKIYFLEKWLSSTLSNLEPEDLDMEKIETLAKDVADYIYSLTIEGLKVPEWPAAVDVDSSSDESVDVDRISIDSDMSLNRYLDKRINYFPMPASINRLPLKSIFQQLTHLTHLNFSFGYDNFSLDKDVKFAKLTDDDITNLAQAIAICSSLFCFKLSRSKFTPSQLDTILLGLYALESFREVELSNLQLTDDHMMTVTNLLKTKSNMSILSLKCNSIGPNGLARLLHTVVLKDCRLKILDVSMNPVGDAGGVAMGSLLAKKNRFLKRVYMSGTGLTHLSGYNFGIVLYFNKCLEVLDLSVNRFDDFAAEALLRGVEHNRTLKRLDLRECGIPFPTVREIECICFKNGRTASQKSYVYPAAHPEDFWSGFEEMDEEQTNEKGEVDGENEEENVNQEITAIFIWATARMKPRNKFMLIRDIHALMKRTVFTTGFNAVADTLILIKQKEIIQKAKMDAKREKAEATEGSGVTADYSIQDYMRRSDEKTKADFAELEALQVLKYTNRCGRIDVLFKSLTPEKIEELLKNIGKILFSDTGLPSAAGMSLPFAKKWYRAFADPEPQDEATGKAGDGCEELEEEYGEEIADGEIEENFEPTSDLLRRSMRKSDSPATTSAIPSRSKSTAAVPSMAFLTEDEFQNMRDRALDMRAKFKKWPKEGPPQFPKVIPFEIVKDCHDDLAGTGSEKEDDLPYWLNEWSQKF
ncbi:unnamed protein product, partial [Nesidiocoris tenuis]